MAITARIIVRRIDQEARIVQHNDLQILDQICSVLESSNDRMAKAQSLAELIGRSGGYRWVGIYGVAGDEIAAIAWTGPDAPAVPRFPVSQGLCGAVVCSGTTVVRASHHLKHSGRLAIRCAPEPRRSAAV